jgi:hypothetical protein
VSTGEFKVQCKRASANPAHGSTLADTGARQKAKEILAATIAAANKDRDMNKARQGFNDALRADPTYSLPRLNLGRLCESQENWDEAAFWYESYLKFDATSDNATVARTALERVHTKRGAIPQGR